MHDAGESWIAKYSWNLGQWDNDPLSLPRCPWNSTWPQLLIHAWIRRTFWLFIFPCCVFFPVLGTMPLQLKQAIENS
jgi:hypothetical protein